MVDKALLNPIWPRAHISFDLRSLVPLQAPLHDILIISLVEGAPQLMDRHSSVHGPCVGKALLSMCSRIMLMVLIAHMRFL
mgnify:CR=1 FL=1